MIYIANTITPPLSTYTSPTIKKFINRHNVRKELMELQRELFKRPGDPAIKLRMSQLRNYLKDTDPRNKKNKSKK